MFQRIGALALLAIVIGACSGNPTTAPQGTETPGPAATETPGATQEGQTNPPPAGDLEATARALVPPGSSETSKFEAGGVFQLYLTSTMSLEELESFWDAKIPSQGMKVEGKFSGSGGVTYIFSNPDGGIVASPDPSAGGFGIVISVSSGS